MYFTIYGVKIPVRSLIQPLLRSVPFAVFFVGVMIMWHYDRGDNNMILIFILALLFVTIMIGRIWNNFFEARKSGKQKKLDGFLEE